MMLPRSLDKRQMYGYGNGYYGYNNGWYSYGRWGLLGAILGFVLLIWLLFFLINMRRRKAGAQPVKYTGWATPGGSRPQPSGATGGYQQQPMPTYNQGHDQNMGYAQTPQYAPPQYPVGQQPQAGYNYNEPTYPAPIREK